MYSQHGNSPMILTPVDDNLTECQTDECQWGTECQRSNESHQNANRSGTAEQHLYRSRQHHSTRRLQRRSNANNADVNYVPRQSFHTEVGTGQKVVKGKCRHRDDDSRYVLRMTYRSGGVVRVERENDGVAYTELMKCSDANWTLVQLFKMKISSNHTPAAVSLSLLSHASWWSYAKCHDTSSYSRSVHSVGLPFAIYIYNVAPSHRPLTFWPHPSVPFYPRDALHSAIFAVVRCPFHPSVTHRYCV